MGPSAAHSADDKWSDQHRDFFGLLSFKSITAGHALGIRHERASGAAHFFAPNVEHLKFPSWDVFFQDLPVYWQIVFQD